PAPGRSHQHLGTAGMAVAEGILARLVDIEGVVRVFDQRHFQVLLHEQRNQFFDQRGFAAAGISGKAENFHALRSPRSADFNSTYAYPTAWRSKAMALIKAYTVIPGCRPSSSRD